MSLGLLFRWLVAKRTRSLDKNSEAYNQRQADKPLNDAQIFGATQKP